MFRSDFKLFCMLQGRKSFISPMQALSIPLACKVVYVTKEMFVLYTCEYKHHTHLKKDIFSRATIISYLCGFPFNILRIYMTNFIDSIRAELLSIKAFYSLKNFCTEMSAECRHRFRLCHHILVVYNILLKFFSSI